MSRRKPKLRTWARGAPLKNGESEDGIVTSGLHDILEEEGPGSHVRPEVWESRAVWGEGAVLPGTLVCCPPAHQAQGQPGGCGLSQVPHGLWGVFFLSKWLQIAVPKGSVGVATLRPPSIPTAVEHCGPKGCRQNRR